jgi:methyl-accepting chemotaxis protein
MKSKLTYYLAIVLIFSLSFTGELNNLLSASTGVHSTGNTESSVSDHTYVDDRHGSSDSHKASRRDTRKTSAAHADLLENEEEISSAGTYITISLLLVFIIAVYMLTINESTALKFNLRGKIMALAGMIIALLIVVVSYALINLEKINDEVVAIAEEDLPLTKAVSEISEHQLVQDVYIEKILKYAHMGTEQFKSEILYNEKQFENFSKRVDHEIIAAEELCEEAIKAEDNEKNIREFKYVLSMLKKIEGEHAQFEEEAKRLFEAIAQGDMHLVDKYEKLIEEEAEQLVTDLTNLNENIASFTIAAALHAEHVEQQTKNALLIISVIALFSALLFSLVMTNKLVRPLVKVVNAIKNIALGDLDQEKLLIKTKDEIEELARSYSDMVDSLKEKQSIIQQIAEGSGDFTIDVKLASDKDSFGQYIQQMLSSLNNVLGQTKASAAQVTSGAEQVSQSSQTLSQGASEQASSLEEISSSVNEINSQSARNSENALQAQQVAKKSMENAEAGNQQMRELVGAMEGINHSADEIKKIVKTIDDIAFQINLLALNANVEAARAGKYGKGFAVVAEEVRNLAARSAKSVNETTQMVEEATKNIETGTSLVELTDKQLNEILDGAGKVVDLVEEISIASNEQSKGLDQITKGLTQIEEVTQSNTASAEESASASEELSSQAEQLSAMVSRFKLKEYQEVFSNHVSENTLNNLVETQFENHNQPNGKKPVQKVGIDPEKVIKLDDDDFGKF